MVISLRRRILAGAALASAVAGMAVVTLAARPASDRALGGAVASAGSLAAQPGPCQCADIPLLIARYHELRAAMAALDQALDVLNERDKNLGRMTMYSPSNYWALVESFVQRDMGRVRDPNLPQPPVPTPRFPPDCRPSIRDQGSACLRPGELENEMARLRECEVRNRDAAKPGDWMSGIRAGWFVLWERDGYKAEGEYIRKQLQALWESRSCVIRGWNGYLEVSYSKEYHKATTLPRPGEAPTAPHGVEQLDITETWEGQINVTDGESYGDIIYYNRNHRATSVSGQDSCHGNMVKKILSDFSWDNSATIVKSGVLVHHASFQVSFRQDGTYAINVSLPDGVVGGQSTSHEYYSGQCPPSVNPQDKAYAIDGVMVSGVHVSGRGKGRATDDVLLGSDTGPKASMAAPSTGATQKESYTIKWQLYRPKAGQR